MDPRERFESDYVATKALIRASRGDMWASLPGILQSFNATKMTCVIQPSIKMQQRQTDGTWLYLTLPLLVDCPVIFPSGGGWFTSFPLAKGDEGLVVFASRCIDNWWLSGGVQKQAELRMHDLSDGFFIPGCFSQPHVPTGVSTTKVQTRNADGTVVIELGTGEITLTAPAVIVNGNLQLNGAIQAVGGGIYAGDIQTGGKVISKAGTGASVELDTHKHAGVTVGAGTSAAPTPGT